MRNPRITITLDPQDYAVLSELSEANGESMSSIVAGLVHTVSPALSRVAEVIRVASSAQGDVLDNLRRVVDDSEATLSPLLSTGFESFDAATAAVISAGTGEDPRSVIRGSVLGDKSTFHGSTQ